MSLELTSSTTNGIQKSSSASDSAVEFKQVQKNAGTLGASISTLAAEHISTKVNNVPVNSDQEKQSEKNTEMANLRLKSAVKRANDTLKVSRTRCEFSYHDETNRVSIKVMDKETNEVIREIPSEEALELVQKMWEMAGILVDEKR